MEGHFEMKANYNFGRISAFSYLRVHIQMRHICEEHHRTNACQLLTKTSRTMDGQLATHGFAATHIAVRTANGLSKSLDCNRLRRPVA